jgi:2-deoxy-D-gluconate 3-dehydrogenase
MTLPKTPSFRLDGKRAFVPGGSRGIGLGCAAALAEAGAHVVIAARGIDGVKSAVQEFEEADLSAEGVSLDVSDVGAVKSFFGSQKPFDVMCNSAGIARHSKAADTDPVDYDAVMGINVRAAYFLAQQAAQGMAGRGGSIVQISSQMGHVGGQDRAVYCGSKHAIEGINKAMAIEYGPDNIRVNSICPTFILTPLTEVTFADPVKRAWIDDKIKLPRVGLIEDIMGAVTYLATDASAMVTGTSILVDGGWTAG